MSRNNSSLRETRQQLLVTARRFTRCEQEAHDLVQDALLAALARGFDDWQSSARRAWLRGVVRNQAALVTRTNCRRRRRESLETGQPGASREIWTWEVEFLETLPPSLRVVAALANIDWSTSEIRWLLGLSDTALRSRLSALRRAVRRQPQAPVRAAPQPAFALGMRRAQLLSTLRRQPGRVVATHDPDGHALLLKMPPHKKPTVGNLSLCKHPPSQNPSRKSMR